MLGAGLINALKQQCPELQVEGIGGDNMREAGMHCLFPMDKLSVLGITEVLGRYLELRSIRNQIRDHFISNPPDVFIGVDAPDFNLWLERQFRQAGIKTIHYVSPSVWAWREYRLKNIRQSIDLMLTLFPFESDYYSTKALPNHYVGHPLADKLAGENKQSMVREQLNIASDKTVIAILPGSRLSEINALTEILLCSARALKQENHALYFISGLVNQKTADVFKTFIDENFNDLDIDVHIGKTHQVLAASDIVLLASGTATLEAMLLNKPMVVAYRLSWISYWLVKMLAKIPYAALPNILANRLVVPECLQANCNSQTIAEHAQSLLNSEKKRAEMKDTFRSISKSLAIDADTNAANAVLQLVRGQSVE